MSKSFMIVCLILAVIFAPVAATNAYAYKTEHYLYAIAGTAFIFAVGIWGAMSS